MEEEESLDCPVCFEQYDDNSRAPKMMTCLHTVCATCILDLLGLEGQHRGASDPEIPRGRKVTCPLCREEILTDKMQTNRYIVAHLHHLIRLGGLSNGETQHKTAPGKGTDRVKAMGIPVLPTKEQHPPRLAPAPRLPRRPTPPPPPRSRPPPPPQRTPPSPQSDPRGVRRASAPLPPSAAGEGERTPPAEGIVAKPPRAFPFGGPQQTPPPPAYLSRALPSPPSYPSPSSYPSPPSSYPSPPSSYPSPPSSYPSPPSSYPPPPAPPAYSPPSPQTAYPPPPSSRPSLPTPPPPPSSLPPLPPLPLFPPPTPTSYPLSPRDYQPPSTSPPSVPPQNIQHPMYPTLSRFSDDSNDPRPRPPSVPTSPVVPGQDPVSPSAPPAVETLEGDLWCRTCDEPAKSFCTNHELIPLLKGDEVAWIEDLQRRHDQEEQDFALALQLTEVSLVDATDSSSSPATKPSVIVPVGRREGVWKGMASSKAKKIEVSKWTYDELRHAINTSSDPLLVKHCHKELQRRWKEYCRTMKRSKRKERKKLR